MKDVTTYVGIDAHKKDLFVSMLVDDQRTPPVSWKVANEPQAVRRLLRKPEREAPGDMRVFYEAGPCGYVLQRQLTTPRVRCEVIAPALMPRKDGRASQDESPRWLQAGGAGTGRVADGGATADPRRRGGSRLGAGAG